MRRPEGSPVAHPGHADPNPHSPVSTSALEVRRTRRGEWIGPGWHQVTRGAHRSTAVADPRLADLRAWQTILPAETRFTHLTAAWLRGWWLPSLPSGLPEIVACPPAANRIRRPGLRAVRRHLRGHDSVAGVRVDPAADTLLACARDLAPLDLMCLVESALARRDCTREELLAVAATPRPGARRLRELVAHAGDQSESAWEVLLRELHRVFEVDVVQQHEVHDEQGRFVARADLWLVGTRDLHEYDGEVHRDAEQHGQDLRRERALLRAGWRRRGYTASDVMQRAVTILADVDAVLGRAHDPARVRAWHDMVRLSCFTSAGRARLAERLV